MLFICKGLVSSRKRSSIVYKWKLHLHIWCSSHGLGIILHCTRFLDLVQTLMLIRAAITAIQQKNVILPIVKYLLMILNILNCLAYIKKIPCQSLSIFLFLITLAQIQCMTYLRVVYSKN